MDEMDTTPALIATDIGKKKIEPDFVRTQVSNLSRCQIRPRRISLSNPQQSQRNAIVPLTTSSAQAFSGIGCVHLQQCLLTHSKIKQYGILGRYQRRRSRDRLHRYRCIPIFLIIHRWRCSSGFSWLLPDLILALTGSAVSLSVPCAFRDVTSSLCDLQCYRSS